MEPSTVRLYEKPGYWNAIANDPAVRPRLVPNDGSVVDVAPLFADGRNAGFRTDHGGFILVSRGPLYEAAIKWATTHEIHAFFAPQADRAPRALADLRSLLATLYIPAVGDKKGYAETDFLWLDADHLVADVPVDDKGSNWLAREGGFKQLEEFDAYGIRWRRWLMTKERYLSFTGLPAADIMAV